MRILRASVASGGAEMTIWLLVVKGLGTLGLSQHFETQYVGFRFTVSVVRPESYSEVSQKVGG